MADILCGIVECIAKITGAAFFHVRIGVVQFAGLVSGRRKTGIGEDFIRGIEAGEVADLSEDHSAHAVADAGNGEDRRGDLIYDLLDGSFNLADLSVEFTNEADGMLKFKRFGGHGGANGSPGGIANFNGFGTAIVPFGSGGEEVGEVCEMAGSDLLCAEEFGKQRIDRRYVERGDEFFQFREQDGDKSGNRLFQFSTLANLVKSVPGS